MTFTTKTALKTGTPLHVPLALSVIIVSYNTQEMTLKCLTALYPALSEIGTEVFVVDNASADGTVAAVRAAFPNVLCLENPANSGFGAANNLALARAAGQHFLLLNSDAFLQPGAVKTLVQYLHEHPNVGAVGPRLLNRDGSLQVSCYRFPSPSRAWMENLWVSALAPPGSPLGDYRRWKHDRERDVDWVSGACFLVRRTAYEQVGGFDERFFMYQEETDWQRRMKDRGWRIAFLPGAVVTHLGGASGADDQARISRTFFDSLDRYEWKHHGLAGLISVRLAMMIGCFLRAVLWTLVLLLVPRRREAARSKARFLAWLFVRQSTHWSWNFKQEPSA